MEEKKEEVGTVEFQIMAIKAKVYDILAKQEMLTGEKDQLTQQLAELYRVRERLNENKERKTPE